MRGIQSHKFNEQNKNESSGVYKIHRNALTNCVAVTVMKDTVFNGIDANSVFQFWCVCVGRFLFYFAAVEVYEAKEYCHDNVVCTQQ